MPFMVTWLCEGKLVFVEELSVWGFAHFFGGGAGGAKPKDTSSWLIEL